MILRLNLLQAKPTTVFWSACLESALFNMSIKISPLYEGSNLQIISSNLNFLYFCWKLLKTVGRKNELHWKLRWYWECGCLLKRNNSMTPRTGPLFWLIAFSWASAGEVSATLQTSQAQDGALFPQFCSILGRTESQGIYEGCGNDLETQRMLWWRPSTPEFHVLPCNVS